MSTIIIKQFIGLIPIFILFIAALIGIFSIAIKRNHIFVYIISVIGFIISILSMFFVCQIIPIDIGMLFYINHYSILYMSIIIISGIITIILAYPYLLHYKFNKEEFYLLLLFSTLGSMVVAISNHLISIFISIELMSFPILGLIGYEYFQYKSLEAALKYMILSGFSSICLLLGIALIYYVSGSLNLIDIGNTLIFNSIYNNNIIILLGLSLILVSFIFKLSIVPFHLWTPDVYEGSSYVVLFFVSSVGKIAVFSLLSRLFLYIPNSKISLIYLILEFMSFISIVFGSVMMLFQKNIKRLLAYSSISNLGYLLITVIYINNQYISLITIGLFTLSYILSNAVFLGSISSISIKNEQKDIDYIKFYRGIFWRHPIIAIMLTIALFSFASIPMSIGFFGKFYLMLLIVSKKSLLLGFGIVLGSIIGLYCYLQVILSFYLKSSELLSNNKLFNSFKLTVLNILIIILSTIIVLFGIYPTYLIELFGNIQWLL
ncbi:NADH-quinone oxidoreductase subunit N [Buchnera aphidicola (Formosaphis micheliae)]|uniref:NADH-quinone oxidoreductase subunit N n=1 Tax=Buchnera aphidicola TaxID=9 RepID=UPI0031CC7231